MNDEKYIDHEVRIRLLEKICEDMHILTRWIFATAIVSVLVPIALKLLIK